MTELTPLKEGDKAPAFNVPSTLGKKIALKDFKGSQRVVLYFYPKDDTPGCTVEACGFRDKFDEIEELNAMILGVSPDSIEKHDKFIDKHELPFVLLSDEDHSLCEAYGVWVEKNNYGKKYMGVQRATFIIDTDGKIGKIYPRVKAEGHNDEVIEWLKKN
ncbi:MAG: thioredoxin-dependent thiol peroxidase [Candidatus Omnitrophica bacterium]|nr:thioredoxin-dependent thiol peroxidase [Candidatus Omnitrophota bacterium]